MQMCSVADTAVPHVNTGTSHPTRIGTGYPGRVRRAGIFWHRLPGALADSAAYLYRNGAVRVGALAAHHR
eukprot:1604631-Rhodomonas_salina.2